MKKLLSILLASAAALSVTGGLAACGDSAHTIKIWAPDGAIKTYEKLAADFKATKEEYAQWKITFEAKGEGDAASAVRTDPSAAPEIYFLASDQISKNVAQNSLAEIPSSYVTQIEARDQKSAVDVAKVDGKMYAFPNSNSNGYFLIYDTEKLSATDVEKLDTIVAKAKTNGQKILFDYGNGFYNPTFFFGLNVGLGDTGGNGKVEVDGAAGKKAGQVYLNYFGEGKNGVFAIPNGNNAIAEGFKAGDTIAGVMGTWVNENNALYEMAEKTTGWTKDRIGFAKLPTFTDADGNQKQMGSFMGAKYVGVNPAKSAEKVEFSLALANYFNSKEAQLAKFEATGEAPTNTEAAKDSKVTGDKMLSALIAQNAAGGHMQLDTPSKFWDATAAFCNDIYSGKTTETNLDAALSTLAAELKK